MHGAGNVDPWYLLDDAQIGPRARWADIFGNVRPVQIDVGPGKGTSLMQLAKRFGEHNFLGIEWANKYCLNVARRVTFWSIDNVKMLRTDGREFLIDRVTSESVRAVHVYFPDPWPKKRHRGRRFFIPETCRALARVLTAGGKVLVRTDHEAYFQEIREQLFGTGALRESTPDQLGDQILADIKTNYETKFVAAGQKIFRLGAEKV